VPNVGKWDGKTHYGSTLLKAVMHGVLTLSRQAAEQEKAGKAKLVCRFTAKRAANVCSETAGCAGMPPVDLMSICVGFHLLGLQT